MEFRYRANDKRPSNRVPSFSSRNTFVQPQLHGAVMARSSPRTYIDSDPLDSRKLREEILMAEIERRRELEAEVRREIALKREIAFRRSHGFYSPSLPVRPDIRVPHPGYREQRNPILIRPESEFSGHYRFGPRPEVALSDRLDMVSRREAAFSGSDSLLFGRYPETERLAFKGREASVMFRDLPIDCSHEVNFHGKMGLMGPREIGQFGNFPPWRRGVEEEVLAMASQPKILDLSQIPRQRRHKLHDDGGLALPERTSGEATVEPLSNDDEEPDNPKEAKLEEPAKPINLNAEKKRKAEAQVEADGSERHANGSNKRMKKDWTCSICQVRATSERVMEDHLKGKKHKAKTKATAKVVAMSSSTSKEEGNDGSKKEESDVEALVEDQNLKDHKFWCQMCKFGTISEALMTKHKNGKKHMSLLKKHGGSLIIISTLPEDAQEAKITVATEEGKEIVEHDEDD